MTPPSVAAKYAADVYLVPMNVRGDLAHQRPGPSFGRQKDMTGVHYGCGSELRQSSEAGVTLQNVQAIASLLLRASWTGRLYVQ